MAQKFYSWIYTQENWNIGPHKHLYTNVQSSVIWAGGVAQMVEHLHTKLKALSSNPSMPLPPKKTQSSIIYNS
jgi:hypothetical protein